MGPGGLGVPALCSRNPWTVAPSCFKFSENSLGLPTGGPPGVPCHVPVTSTVTSVRSIQSFCAQPRLAMSSRASARRADLITRSCGLGQQAADQLEEIQGTVGLGHVRGCPRLERLLLVAGQGEGGDSDDGSLGGGRLGSECPRGLDAR